MKLLTNLPQNLPEELTTVLQQSENMRIERIVSRGRKSPEGFWYPAGARVGVGARYPCSILFASNSAGESPSNSTRARAVSSDLRLYCPPRRRGPTLPGPRLALGMGSVPDLARSNAEAKR